MNREETRNLLLLRLWRLASCAAQVLEYQLSWSPKFSIKELQKVEGHIYGQLTREAMLTLTPEDLLEFRFNKWSEENPIRMIPLWVYRLIPNGETLVCIDGTRVVKGTDYIDNDVRSGLMAYGFDLAELPGTHDKTHKEVPASAQN